MNAPRKLSSQEAKAKILQILETGEIVPTWYHAKKRMKQRDVMDDDIREALTNGEIKCPPEWDDRYNKWKYRVEGTDIEGEQLRVITIIVEQDHLLRILSVF